MCRVYIHLYFYLFFVACYQSGEMETTHIKQFTERNEYLDIILTEILKHGKDRRVILSCFDPDICTM